MAADRQDLLAGPPEMSRGGFDRPGRRELARPEAERLVTPATLLTFLRTAATLGLALAGAGAASLGLLLGSLAVYWLGDVADGLLARMLDQETRIGALLDIMCDRLSASAFYIGFAWYDPTMAVPVGIYLAEFLVVDMFLSVSFLAFAISSPNYFYVVDARLWRWNWSKPAKVLNSAPFALLLVLTREPWSTSAVALALAATKLVSVGWLMRLGLPIPDRLASLRDRPPSQKDSRR
jgi:CDP-diacylglycerol---glycerol-3-phosphate 3-phosphatidyltransferase